MHYSTVNFIGSAVFAAVVETVLAAAVVLGTDVSTATCTDGFVVCDDGYQKSADGQIIQSCAEACEGKCCVGFFSCQGFTGNICKDGSCSGWQACKFSKIPYVVDSCTSDNSCYSNTNRTKPIISSCNGDRACMHKTYWLSDDPIGQIGTVVNSCNGQSACYYVGNFGQIGDISDSCNGVGACIYGANIVGDSIASITRSCNADNACQSFGEFAGNLAGAIVDSCNAPSSCVQAADAGNIGSITASCNAKNACDRAGSLYSQGEISSNLNYCCNSEYECAGVNETSLPNECRSIVTGPPMMVSKEMQHNVKKLSLKNDSDCWWDAKQQSYSHSSSFLLLSLIILI